MIQILSMGIHSSANKSFSLFVYVKLSSKIYGVSGKTESGKSVMQKLADITKYHLKITSLMLCKWDFQALLN